MAARTLLLAYSSPPAGRRAYTIEVPGEAGGWRKARTFRIEAASIQEAYEHLSSRLQSSMLLQLTPDHAYLWNLEGDPRRECLPACRIVGELLGVEACPSWRGDWCTVARASLQAAGGHGDFHAPIPERSVFEQGLRIAHRPGPGVSQYYGDWAEGVAAAAILETLHYAEQEMGGPVEVVIAAPETPARARPIALALALYSLSLAADGIQSSPTLYTLTPGPVQAVQARVKYTVQLAYTTLYQYSLPARNLAMGGESPLSKTVSQRIAKLVASSIPAGLRGDPIPPLAGLAKAEALLAASSTDACKAPASIMPSGGGLEVWAPASLDGQVGLLAPVYASLEYARVVRRGVEASLKVEDRRGRLIVSVREADSNLRVLPEPGRGRFEEWLSKLLSSLREAAASVEPHGMLTLPRRRIELELVERRLFKHVEKILADPSA